MDGFPSGQRERTVNPLSQTTMVRIHPRPPKKKSSQGTALFLWSMKSSSSHRKIAVRFLKRSGNKAVYRSRGDIPSFRSAAKIHHQPQSSGIFVWIRVNDSKSNALYAANEAFLSAGRSHFLFHRGQNMNLSETVLMHASESP